MYFIINFNNNKMINKKIKKKVRFNGNTIFLIPYTKDKTGDVLWWTTEDHSISKADAREEIIRLITIHKSMLLRDALKLLYQPNNISYNEDNFH
jgi:hypothetical protein